MLKKKKKPHKAGSLPTAQMNIKHLGQKTPHDISSPTSCSKQGQLWDQTRLLRVFFSCALKTLKDGDCTTTLGNLLRCLIFLM